MLRCIPRTKDDVKLLCRIANDSLVTLIYLCSLPLCFSVLEGYNMIPWIAFTVTSWAASVFFMALGSLGFVNKLYTAFTLSFYSW